MSNVLLVFNDGVTSARLALVPSDKLEKYDLDNIQDVDAGSDEVDDTIFEEVSDLFGRVGLEPNDDIKTDLQRYLNPTPPFTADRVVNLIWT